MNSKRKDMANGFFGDFGGSFVPEPLIPVLTELKEAYAKYKDDKEFINDIKYYN